MPSLSEAAARLRRPGGDRRDDSRWRWKDRRRQRQSRRFTFASPSLGGDALAFACFFLLAFSPLPSRAQPRPPSNNKIVTVPAGERVLEGLRISNPSSADNIALIKFRDGLTGVVRERFFFPVKLPGLPSLSAHRRRSS